MSRTSKIRWSDADEKQLKKTVRNFNDKIRRIEKKVNKQLENPNLTSSERKELHDKKNYLPSKVKYSDLKSEIRTRQDLKREMNSLKRFSKKGSEEIVVLPNTDYNLKTTKWQKKEMSIMVSTINRRRKERYKKTLDLEATSRGKELGYKLSDVGFKKRTELELASRTVTSPKMTQTDLKKRFESLKKEIPSTFWDEKDQRLKENYIKALEANYSDAKYKSSVEVIKKAINSMTFSNFWKKFNSEGCNMEFIYLPPSDHAGNAMDANMTALLSTWSPHKVPTDFEPTFDKVKSGGKQSKQKQQKQSKKGKR